MTSSKVDLLRDNILKSLIQNRLIIIWTTVGFAIASMVYFQFATKKYKVSTTVSVQPQFFQIPLVRDFVPESFDGGELRSQREALILRSLSPEFLARIIDTHHLGGKKTYSQMNTSEIAGVMHRFEIIPIGTTNFMISFFAPNAQTGYAVVQEFLDQIKLTMDSQRNQTLLRVHDAIQERLEALSMKGGDKSTPPGLLAARPDLLRQEIARNQEQLAELRKTYSEKHPRVTALIRKLDSLSRWLKTDSDQDASPQFPPRRATFSAESVDSASLDLFKDLLKKYHYLEVVIYLDQQNPDGFLSILEPPFVPLGPIWPKRPIILLWGIVSGFLVGSISILVREGLKERKRRLGQIPKAAPEPSA